MSFKLSKQIAAYFAADQGDVQACAQCFTDNAVVKDEGQTYSGLTAIKRWRTEAAMKYVYTSEPFASEEKDGKTVITSRLTGNFPGSPINLRFFFGLEGDKIASLEIIL